MSRVNYYNDEVDAIYKCLLHDTVLWLIGVGQMTRMAAKFLKPEMTIAQEGNAWTIKSTSSLKNHEFTFTPGQEFELTTADGRQVKVS